MRFFKSSTCRFCSPSSGCAIRSNLAFISERNAVTPCLLAAQIHAPPVAVQVRFDPSGCADRARTICPELCKNSVTEPSPRPTVAVQQWGEVRCGNKGAHESNPRCTSGIGGHCPPCMSSKENGPLTGCWAQMSSWHWPACVMNAVLAGTAVPSSDSPSGHTRVATSTPLTFPARTQAKLK
jgi:hypothetical protein